MGTSNYRWGHTTMSDLSLPHGQKQQILPSKRDYQRVWCILLQLIMLASSLVCARITQVKPGVLAIINQLENVKGKAMPLSFRMVTDSSQHEIEEFKGKVVLLNFWATWCKPCLTEIPDLNQIAIGL